MRLRLGEQELPLLCHPRFTKCTRCLWMLHLYTDGGMEEHARRMENLVRCRRNMASLFDARAAHTDSTTRTYIHHSVAQQGTHSLRKTRLKMNFKPAKLRCISQRSGSESKIFEILVLLVKINILCITKMYVGRVGFCFFLGGGVALHFFS